MVPIGITDGGKWLELCTGYIEVVTWGVVIVIISISADIVLVSVMLA